MNKFLWKVQGDTWSEELSLCLYLSNRLSWLPSEETRPVFNLAPGNVPAGVRVTVNRATCD